MVDIKNPSQLIIIFREMALKRNEDYLLYLYEFYGKSDAHCT
jgi:hypothetical protein